MQDDSKNKAGTRLRSFRFMPGIGLLLIFVLIVMSVVFPISSFYRTGMVKNFWELLIAALLIVILFFALFRGRVDKKEIAKKYFLLSFSIFFSVLAFAGVFTGARFLSQGMEWRSLMIWSLCLLITIPVFAGFAYYKIEGLSISSVIGKKREKFFVQKRDDVFCHKCGTKNIASNAFCGACGEKLWEKQKTCNSCGELLLADSEFCPYCGNALGNYSIEENVYNNDLDAVYNESVLEKADADRILRGVSRTCSYIFLFVFIALFFNMAPEIGGSNWAPMIIGITVAVSLVYWHRKATKKSRKKIFCFITSSVFVLATVVLMGLQLTYEIKRPEFLAYIPETGTIRLRIDFSEELFTTGDAKVVDRPFTTVTINGVGCEKGEIVDFTMQKEYVFLIRSGYSGNSGQAEKTVAFTKDNYMEALQISEEILLDGNLRFYNGLNQYVEISTVNISFERYCNFWEVVFF